MKEIYKYLNLTPENETKSHETFYKILYLNDKFSLDDILAFFLQHKRHNEKVICNGKETISLQDAMLESTYYTTIVKYCNTFEHANVIEYHITHFNTFKITSFVCSATYQKIILAKLTIKKDLAKLLVLILNSYYDFVNVEKMLTALPIEEMCNVNLNKYTFAFVLKKCCLEILTKLMVYQISTIEEVKLTIEKLNDYDFYKAIVKHIKSQQIINNTMLVFALLIKEGLEDLDIKNADIGYVVGLFDDKRYLYFNNKTYKKLLFRHIMDVNFDLELFTFSVSENTNLMLREIAHVETECFTANDIYLMYFYKKFYSQADKCKLRNDVNEIIINKIYDTEVLEFLLLHDLDFLLFGQDEIVALKNTESVKDIISYKYVNVILKSNIQIESDVIKKYTMIIENIEEKDAELPIIRNPSIFDNDQIVSLLQNYTKSYDINLFLHILTDRQITEESIENFVAQNFTKIKSPVDKILIIDKYKLENINTDFHIRECIKKIKNDVLMPLLARISNIDIFLPYFCIDSINNMCMSQDAFNVYLTHNPDYLQILNMLQYTKVNENFMSFYLTALFQSDIDVSIMMDNLPKIFGLLDYSKRTLLMCCNFYIKILSQDEFVQSHDLTSARDFLNIIYLYMKKRGKDKCLQIRCEKIVNCVRSLSIYFDCEIVMKNIKSISK